MKFRVSLEFVRAKLGLVTIDGGNMSCASFLKEDTSSSL